MEMSPMYILSIVTDVDLLPVMALCLLSQRPHVTRSGSR